jgi:hypothetical protein
LDLACSTRPWDHSELFFNNTKEVEQFRWKYNCPHPKTQARFCGKLVVCNQQVSQTNLTWI